MSDTVRRWAKKTVRYPEDAPKAASVKELRSDVAAFKPFEFVKQYLITLFPILQWIGRYNTHWLTGDVIAGLTVGMVLVPQSMSYAKIATLDPQYGLYSSFVGAFIYCFFATSKDVSIGPVAVMSLETSKIIAHIQHSHPNVWSAPQIATTTAFICGFIVLGIGLLRIGRLVELIPAPAVSGFMTGSAINIAAGQVPGLFGTSGLFNTRGATYLVIIDTLKFLPKATLDTAFGLTGLVCLYLIRGTFSYLSRRYPHRERFFFFLSIIRNAFVLIILTLASWLYCRHRVDKKGNYPIQILKTVPRGFQHVGRPVIDKNLVSALGPDLFVATVILLLEHIAIAKSFGRRNGYKINPNQELVAIGVTNTVGTLFNAYPATGSFSRSALNAKSGVRTPAAGLLTGLVVVVALYGLTDAFFWIPTAALSAIIIHAVADLVASPSQVFNFWRVSPFEFVIWWAAVLVTVFSSIENGIYTSIISSLVLLVVRIMVPRGVFLGKVSVQVEDGESAASDGANGSRVVFLPLDSARGNPHVKVTQPLPGVVIYRHEDGLLYPNASAFNGVLVDYIKETTRPGRDPASIPLSERAWNDPAPRHSGDLDPSSVQVTPKPLLRAVVLDFSSVTHVDTTAVQSLVDTRAELQKWASGPVEFHFASILSPWIRRALIAGGFGGGQLGRKVPYEVAPVVPPRHQSYSNDNKDDFRGEDLEASSLPDSSSLTPVVSTETPFFHLDLASAVASAESGVPAGKSV